MAQDLPPIGAEVPQVLPPVGGEVVTKPSDATAPMNFAIVNGQKVNLDDSPIYRAAKEFYEKSPIGGVVNVVKGTANAVSSGHPLDAAADAIIGAAKAQWDQAIQAAQKAKEAGASGVQGVKALASGDMKGADAAGRGFALSASEAAGHGMAAILPMLGPLAANVGEHGAAGDVAGMVGGAAGLLSPFAVKYGLEQRAAANPAKADLLRRDAEQQVAQRVLAPANPKFKGQAQAIAPEVLRRGLSGDRIELQQVAEQGMADAGARIDAANTAAGGPTMRVDPQPILNTLTKKINDFSLNGKPLPNAVGKVETLTKLRDYIKALPQPTYGDLQKVRDDAYAEAAKAGGYDRLGLADKSDQAWGAKQVGAAIQQHFGQLRPETAAANADFYFHNTLDEILDPVQGRPKTGTATTGATGGLHTTGAIVGSTLSKVPVIGPVAAFVGSKVIPWLAERQASPAWQLAKASDKIKLANALKAGQIGQAQSLMSKIAQFVPRETATAPLATAAQTDQQPPASAGR